MFNSTAPFDLKLVIDQLKPLIPEHIKHIGSTAEYRSIIHAGVSHVAGDELSVTDADATFIVAQGIGEEVKTKKPKPLKPEATSEQKTQQESATESEALELEKPEEGEKTDEQK